MNVEKLKGGWEKCGSVISFPYDWQRPAKTEEWVYETLISKGVNSHLVEFIAFPWATLIDLIDYNQITQAEKLLLTLNELPAKKTLIRATACQHIKLELIENLLKKLNITDIYWAHKTINRSKIETIRLHPMALYPVTFYKYNSTPPKEYSERKYKFSFIGAYNKNGYMSNIREKIFSLKGFDNTYIKKRDEWHFQNDVYTNQILGKVTPEAAQFAQQNYELEYVHTMMETVYSLCPSGAGPNTIRYWESLSFGCIPVCFSENLDKAVKGIYEVSSSEILFDETINKINNEKIFPNKSQGNIKKIVPTTWLSNIYDDLFKEKHIFSLMIDDYQKDYSYEN